MLSNPQLVAQSGAIVSEEGPIAMQFGDSNINYADGDIITIVLYEGTYFSTTSPTCTDLIGSFTVSSCSYVNTTRTLTMTITSPSSDIALIYVNMTNFIYPGTSLTNWPSSGGATITVTDSSGATQKGVGTNVKITGVGSGSITTITITEDPTKTAVGESDATITFSVTVPHQVPTTGTMTIFFPTQPVSGSHVVTSPTCTGLNSTMSSSLS